MTQGCYMLGPQVNAHQHQRILTMLDLSAAAIGTSSGVVMMASAERFTQAANMFLWSLVAASSSTPRPTGMLATSEQGRVVRHAHE